LTDVVLVHGNPETAAIWGPLIEALGLEGIMTLSPPGFGAPVPVGFVATTDDYLGRLVAELERLPEPVDLVGHDWGVMWCGPRSIDPTSSARGSSTSGAAWAPDYEWHDTARVWQTSGAGRTPLPACSRRRSPIAPSSTRRWA
jgi:pimeloyl-ACP methyl ester carboxylesterase